MFQLEAACATLLAAAVQTLMLAQCFVSYTILRFRGRLSESYSAGAAGPREDAPTDLLIVIPAYNEAANIEAHLRGLASRAAHPELCDVAVSVDTGSKDNTKALTERVLPELGFRSCVCCASTGGRGAALIAGLRAGNGESGRKCSAVLFLHSDTLLPVGFDDTIRAALADPRALATAFTFALSEPPAPIPGAGVMERTVLWRSRYLQLPFGDQAIALRSSTLALLGGVPDAPIMEDYVLVQKLRWLHACGQGRIVTLRERSRCSPRRWAKNGVWRTNLVNQAVMIWRV